MAGCGACRSPPSRGRCRVMAREFRHEVVQADVLLRKGHLDWDGFRTILDDLWVRYVCEHGVEHWGEVVAPLHQDLPGPTLRRPPVANPLVALPHSRAVLRATDALRQAHRREFEVLLAGQLSAGVSA